MSQQDGKEKDGFVSEGGTDSCCASNKSKPHSADQCEDTGMTSYLGKEAAAVFEPLTHDREEKFRRKLVVLHGERESKRKSCQ